MRKYGYGTISLSVFRIRIGLNTNPDPAFEVNTDLDTAFVVNTDPDQGCCMTDM